MSFFGQIGIKGSPHARPLHSIPFHRDNDTRRPCQALGLVLSTT